MAEKTLKAESGFPMQPIVRDEDGTMRFRKNKLVRYLLDRGPHDLNYLAMLPDVPREDWEQFAQLIGYSVSGFGDLDYASEDQTDRADLIVETMLKREREEAAEMAPMEAEAIGKRVEDLAVLYSITPTEALSALERVVQDEAAEPLNKRGPPLANETHHQPKGR